MSNTIDAAKIESLKADLAKWGFVTCPCCGWNGLTVTKAGKIRKHGRKQTGQDGLSCKGSEIMLK